MLGWATTCALGLVPARVVIVGGSSGMGKGCAKAVIQRGGSVLIVSRSAEKLASARAEIASESRLGDDALERVQTAACDARDERAVEQLAARLGDAAWDGLVVSAAGTAPHGPIAELERDATAGLFESKFWTAHNCCKHLAPRLAEGGAVVLVAGVLNRRPGVNCSPLACVNGALEGLTRALALEFGPRLRVNCLSPGFCATERFDAMDAARREAMLANTAASLPLKRVGQPADMGTALDFLLCGEFVTGVVLDCDGGHHIRQYASAATDPMREPARASNV